MNPISLNSTIGGTNARLSPSLVPGASNCPHAHLGCRWQGLMGQVEGHLQICAFEQMKDYIQEKEKQIQELRYHIQQFQKAFSNMKSEGGMYHLNMEGHVSIVVALAVVDRMLFSGSMDGTLKVWDLATFTAVREIQLGPVFSLQVEGNRMFSGHLNSIKVWDLQTFGLLATLTGHVGNVKALCVMGNRLFSGSSDLSIKVWNLDNYQCLHTLGNAHEGEIRSLVAVTNVNGDMVHLWSCSDDSTIRIWNKNFNCERVLKGHKGPVKVLKKSGDFIFSGSEDTYIKVWNALDSSEVASISCLIGVTSLAISRSSNVPSLISGHNDGAIKVWNLQNLKSPECQCVLSAHTEAVRDIIVANNIFFSGGYDKTIKVWYPQHQRLYFNFQPQ